VTTGQHTSFDDAKITLKHLLAAGYPSMFAGGCVRDRLLQVLPKDYDIATTATPEQTIAVFSNLGYRIIPSGIDHGTVTVISKTGPVEITTLRQDVKTDGRHATVDFNNATFESDAQRRDFTINALYEDEHGQIHDFCGGLDDLKQRSLRFVGAPVARIKEDYLRILRFFRFWSRFEFTPDPLAISAIKSEASGLKNISQERITSELWGIISANGASAAINSMIDTGVMALVLPEAVSFSKAQSIIFLDATALPENLRPWVNLAVLLGVTQQRLWTKHDLQNLCKRLRFSDKQSKILIDIITGWQSLSSLPRQTAAALSFASAVEHHGEEFKLINFFSPLWMFFGRHCQTVTQLESLSWMVSVDLAYGERRHRDLPVSGHDVLQTLPHLKGANIGDVMQKLKIAFYNGEWTSRQEGLDYLMALNQE
jgi:tRNA nucleotidyltransferase/poly(A) polymerase